MDIERPGYPRKTDVDRSYRKIQTPNLLSFRLSVGESDLWVSSTADVKSEVERLLLCHRRRLKEYIHHNPDFATALEPYPSDAEAPGLVQWMIDVSAKVGVGPMAAVAGAFAGMIGQSIDSSIDELIIENGGDIYLRSNRERVIGIFAGNSPFSMKIGLQLKPKPDGYGICTSAGTVGPSLSLGKADATVVISSDPALADAAATAIGNHVQTPADLERASDLARKISGIDGVVIIKDDKMAAWGDIDLVPL